MRTLILCVHRKVRLRFPAKAPTESPSLSGLPAANPGRRLTPPTDHSRSWPVPVRSSPWSTLCASKLQPPFQQPPSSDHLPTDAREQWSALRIGHQSPPSPSSRISLRGSPSGPKVDSPHMVNLACATISSGRMPDACHTVNPSEVSGIDPAFPTLWRQLLRSTQPPTEIPSTTPRHIPPPSPCPS
jgi:hypothetical protein